METKPSCAGPGRSLNRHSGGVGVKRKTAPGPLRSPWPGGADLGAQGKVGGEEKAPGPLCGAWDTDPILKNLNLENNFKFMRSCENKT